MMLPSHLLAVVLAGLLIDRVRPLGRKGWLLALGFGVAIDVDHLLQVPAYVALHGWGALTPASMLAWGSAWQGVMHTPWALVPVLGAAILFRSVVPAAAWGLHMVQDFVIARHLVVFGSPTEWAIVAVLTLLVASVLHLGRREGESLARRARRAFLPDGPEAADAAVDA